MTVIRADTKPGTGTVTPAADTPAFRGHRLGLSLRQMRQTSSLRLEDVAARLDLAPSTLPRIETGKAPARTSYVKMMLDLYGVDDPGQVRLLTDLAIEGQRKDSWADLADLLPAATREYLGLEAAASEIRCYAALSLPGLFQTPDYVTATLRTARPALSARHITKLADITPHRQELLRQPSWRLHAVIDEAALIRPAGSADVMAAQIRHLADLAASPNVTVQVVPLTTPLPAFSPAFSLLSFPGTAPADTACIAGPCPKVSITSHPADVRDLAAVFARLTRAALPPADSVQPPATFPAGTYGLTRTEPSQRS